MAMRGLVMVSEWRCAAWSWCCSLVVASSSWYQVQITSFRVLGSAPSAQGSTPQRAARKSHNCNQFSYIMSQRAAPGASTNPATSPRTLQWNSVYESQVKKEERRHEGRP